jgi:hypothetical protein
MIFLGEFLPFGKKKGCELPNGLFFGKRPEVVTFKG